MSKEVLLLLCFCAVAAFAQYTNKYNNVDVDKILASKRLVNNYVQCLLDKKPCSPEGAELKKVLPDAIKTKCNKCSDFQRSRAVKVITKMQKDYPAEWKQLTDKWDPKGQLMREFQQELARSKGGKGK